MEPKRKPRRRWVRWLALTAAVVAIALAITLWQLTRSQPDRFARRYAPMVGVEAGAEQPEAGGFVSQPVRVRAANGLEVDFRVLRPAGTGDRRLPLVMVLGGHRTGRDAVDLLGAPGPLVVAALDYPYDGPERPRGLPQSLETIPPARRGLRDTPAAVLLAIDWLVSQPWVDPARVELVGVSLGSPFAMVAGALDQRVRRVWLIHGGADNRQWIEHNLRARIESDALRRLAGGLVYVLAHGPSLQAEYWMPRIAPRPVVIIGARQDQRLPVHLVEQLHAAALPPKELIWMDGGHVDRQAGAVRYLLEVVTGRVLAE